MQLKEFVNSRVETVQCDDTLQRAAEKMRELDVGSLPVCATATMRSPAQCVSRLDIVDVGSFGCLTPSR